MEHEELQPVVLAFDLPRASRTRKRTSLFEIIVCLVWLPSKRIQQPYVSGVSELLNSTFEQSIAFVYGGDVKLHCWRGIIYWSKAYGSSRQGQDTVGT
ncbi:hypothetical protein BJY01DRAFT_158467 [Aspergillus pseudoustus]|uniref:Uncharacterized protein n=1 Tax=Aspergillus pseudoustus TaxID=1810923 RepID=A0ABR4KXX0_9EURO